MVTRAPPGSEAPAQASSVPEFLSDKLEIEDGHGTYPTLSLATVYPADPREDLVSQLRQQQLWVRIPCP